MMIVRCCGGNPKGKDVIKMSHKHTKKKKEHYHNTMNTTSTQDKGTEENSGFKYTEDDD